MPSRILCPECETAFAYSPALLGRTVRCRQCQHTFQITAPPPDEPANAPLAPAAPPPVPKPVVPPPLPPKVLPEERTKPRPRSRRDDDYPDDRPRRRPTAATTTTIVRRDVGPKRRGKSPAPAC